MAIILEILSILHNFTEPIGTSAEYIYKYRAIAADSTLCQSLFQDHY